MGGEGHAFGLEVASDLARMSRDQAHAERPVEQVLAEALAHVERAREAADGETPDVLVLVRGRTKAYWTANGMSQDEIVSLLSMFLWQHTRRAWGGD